jgi:GntR family transcriptional regulator/MocR family aminotransferase
MRTLYAQRQQLLIEVMQQELGETIQLKAHEAGMHLIGWLPQGMNDRLLSQRAAQQRIDVPALSACSEYRPERAGLLLGYAGVNEQEMREGIKQLARVVEGMR